MSNHQSPFNSVSNNNNDTGQKKSVLKHSPVYNCASEPNAIITKDDANILSLTSWVLQEPRRSSFIVSKTAVHDSISPRQSISFSSPGTSASNSVSSIRSERRVKFKDEGNNNASNEIPQSNEKLVKVAYFETLMESKEPWEDPCYYAGFRDVFTAGQLWLSDISFIPFAKDSSFEIRDKDGESLYVVQKRQQILMTLNHMVLHSLFPCWHLRNGFTITIFSKPSRIPLIQFIRKSHYCVDQLDIVETIYVQDRSYVGRIERTAHGYLIRDKDNEDIYRVLQPRPKDLLNKKTPTSWKKTKRKQLKMYRTDTKEVVGRIVYQERGVLLRPFTPCLRTPDCGLICNPDLGTNAKLLMLGTLFFHLHQKDKYKENLPLGSDALLSSRDIINYPSEAVDVASSDIIL